MLSEPLNNPGLVHWATPSWPDDNRHPARQPKGIKRLLLSVPKHIQENLEQGARARGTATPLKLSPFKRIRGVLKAHRWSHSFRSYHKHPWLKPHPWIYEVLGRWRWVTSNSTTQKSWRPNVVNVVTFLHTNLYWHFINIQTFWDIGFEFIESYKSSLWYYSLFWCSSVGCSVVRIYSLENMGVTAIGIKRNHSQI